MFFLCARVFSHMLLYERETETKNIKNETKNVQKGIGIIENSSVSLNFFINRKLKVLLSRGRYKIKLQKKKIKYNKIIVLITLNHGGK